MKFAATTIFLGLVAAATVQSHNVPEFGKGPLHDDIQYFLDKIPMDEVAMIVVRYAAEDPEFMESLEYMKGPEFKQMLVEIEKIPQFVNFLNYLENNGVHAYAILDKLNSRLGIELSEFPLDFLEEANGGLAGLFEEVKALISYDDFIHGYVYKMKTSEAFRGFIEQLKSSNFQEMINNIYANKIFQKGHASLTAKGVNIRLIEDIAYVVLGLTFPGQGEQKYMVPNTELAKDFLDFADLAYTPEVNAVIERYMKNDKEVQKGFAYMTTSEFHEMVRAVEAMKEYQDLVIYLEEAGLPAVEYIKSVHYLIGMEVYVPPKAGKYFSIEYAATTGGMKAMFEEVMALLPKEQLKALYREKMSSSKAFADFIAHISSPEFQRIVNKVYTHEIFLEMRAKAEKAGLDLQGFAEFIHAVLGLDFPKP